VRPRPPALLVPLNGRNPSPRERDILTLLAHGATMTQAATALGIAPSNVRNRVDMMRNRYAPTTASLVALAIRLEWIEFRVDIGSRTPDS